MNTSSGATTVIKKIRKFIKKKPSFLRDDEESTSAKVARRLSRSNPDNKKNAAAIAPETKMQTKKEIQPRSGPNLFLFLPTELLTQIVVEIGKLSLSLTVLENVHVHKDVSRVSLLNFGLTCRRHLDIVLPELHRNIELQFPLKLKYIPRMGDMKKTGVYTKSLVFRVFIDTLRHPRPDSILELFPNITTLRLSFKFIDAGEALRITEVALSIFKQLKDFTLLGRVATQSLVYLPGDNFDYNSPKVPLERLRVHFTGFGSPSFIVKLTQILQNCCGQLRTLEYRPFEHLERSAVGLVWRDVGFSMSSRMLEDLRVNVPAGHSLLFLKFLETVVAGKRDKVRVLHLFFKESRMGVIYFGDKIQSEILRFQNLVRLRISHIKAGDAMSHLDRLRADELMQEMIQTFAKDLKALKEMEWYETAPGGKTTWKWRRGEEGIRRIL
ncbi:hypothetical protein ABW19_dt0209684 [Dactylella cylindrospora]|nr:hypothetical protein ABW19_dt0209684 [Dactylella cylindrospora]